MGMRSSAGDGRLAIAGIGEVKPERSLPGDVESLVIDAIELALTDAGLTFADVDGIVCEYSSMPGLLSTLVATLGLPPETFMAQIGLAGVGLVGAPRLARLALEAGEASTIVCFYGSKFGSESSSIYEYHANLPYKANFELPVGFFPQAAYMAAMGRRYLAQYGYEQDDLGHVVRSQREWAVLHEDAIKRELLSEHEYLAKPLVADPLRNVDCALMNDGAVAFVMTTEARARDLAKPVVAAAGVSVVCDAVAEHSHLGLRPDLTSLPSRFSAPRALAEAGIVAGDIDVFELYDCFSVVPVVQLEDIGVCERGEALDLYRKGEMRPGGAIPVNTHGGLLAHSYLMAGNHLVEAVKQLRGAAEDRQVADARTALVTGWSAQEHASLVLQRA